MEKEPGITIEMVRNGYSNIDVYKRQETRRQQQEKMCSQKDHGAFTDAQEQRSQLWQMQSHRSLFSAQRMKKISAQNFINRKMLRGDIPVWANSEMLQREE